MKEQQMKAELKVLLTFLRLHRVKRNQKNLPELDVSIFKTKPKGYQKNKNRRRIFKTC